MESKELILLQRDCMASMVPSGAQILLHEGTEVVLVQALGNSYTVNVFGNLARIDANNADALGKEKADLLADLPADSSMVDTVWYVLKTVFDPEIPVNIVDLGLIYNVVVDEVEQDQFNVHIEMTLTAPGCGMGPVITEDARYSLMTLPGVLAVDIQLVFDPPWEKSMMSDIAQLELGML